MPTGQPAGDRIVWDDANEKHLLLCILAEANPTKLDWSRIAESFGKKLSAGAASQKYGKIKTRDKKLFDGGGGVATPSGSKRAGLGSAKATPTTASKRTGNGLVKNTTSFSFSENLGDDEDVMKTPSKKTKIKEEVIDDTSSAMDDEV